jgi:hypothetical protein
VAFQWVAVDGIRAVEAAVAVDLVDLAAEVLAAVVQGGRGNGIIFRFAFLKFRIKHFIHAKSISNV